MRAGVEGGRVQVETTLITEATDGQDGVDFYIKPLLSPPLSAIYLFIYLLTYFCCAGDQAPKPCPHTRQASLNEPSHPQDLPLSFDMVSL